MVWLVRTATELFDSAVIISKLSRQSFPERTIKSITYFLAGVAVLSPLSACAKGSSQNKPADTIAAYELMRKTTGQKHSHVEYCENDIVKLTISSRGQLNIREIYVPRKAVVHFKNRDTLNTYPLGVRLVADCLLHGASDDCRKGTKILGVNVSLLDTAERRVQGALNHHNMELTTEKVDGLYVMQVSEDTKAEKKFSEDDLIYTNFSPRDLSGEGHLPAVFIKYDSHRLKRADLKRCNWAIYTDEAIRTSRASHCDDLSEWKMYVSEFDALSDKISKNGEYANDCRL